jgi:hypothetical protein
MVRNFGECVVVNDKQCYALSVIWDMMPCSMVGYHCFGGEYCLHLHRQCDTEMLVAYQTTQHHIPDDRNREYSLL